MTAPDILPDEINMTVLADVEFLKSTNAPAIWHEGAIATLAYVGDEHGFLPWLVQQPNMDRATAGWLFLWSSQGLRYLRGERLSFYASIPDGAVVDLLAALCERSERTGFSEDHVGLTPDFEQERRACQDAVAKGEIPSGITVPSAIIGKPFRAATYRGSYECHDGLLVNKRLFE